MPPKEAKQENANLRANVESLTQEIATLKATIEQQEARPTSQRHGLPEDCTAQAAANVTTEDEHTLSYLSKEYHDLNDFRTAVKKELQRLGKCVLAKEFSMKQTNSRLSSISSIAGPRMVLFIFARVMNQEPFGLRMSVASPDFKEGDKLISFHS